MKKIIPFKKEIPFKTNVSEITSISLEHSFEKLDNNIMHGELIITGDYKMTDSSTNTENFEFNLPCDINLDERYDITNADVNIADFYYELINSNVMEVNIEVVINKLEEKLIEKEIVMESLSLEADEDVREDNTDMDKTLEEEVIDTTEVERCVEDEVEEMEVDNVKSLFNNFDDSGETYKTYKVYIIREGDTIDSIMQKYSCNKEDLELYNDLTDIKLGEKLIIPSLINEKN